MTSTRSASASERGSGGHSSESIKLRSMTYSGGWCRAALVASSLAAGPLGGLARAEAPPGAIDGRGRVALSVENLVGVSYASSDYPVSAETTKTERVASRDVAILGYDPAGRWVNAYSFPRLAVDLFTGGHLTAGAAVAVFHTTRPVSTTGLLFAPRGGFLWRLGPRVSLWPRVGLDFIHASSSAGPEVARDTMNQLAVGLDASVAIVLTPSTALMVGPSANFGIHGTRTEQVDTPIATSARDVDLGIRGGLSIVL